MNPVVSLKSALCAVLFSLAASSGCISERPQDVPSHYTETDSPVSIYPDYQDIVIPPNIAPLNFLIRSEGSRFVASLSDGTQELIASARAGAPIQFDETAWHDFLHTHRGDTLRMTIYAHRAEGWVRHPAYTLFVAEEEIDPFVAYRLIEPGYSYYRQLGLYQRNLSGFDEFPIYENNRKFDFSENHCVNCHSFQSYQTKRMLFHVRTNHAGTVISFDDELRKVNFRIDSISTGAVYPAWHPQLDAIAFSTNHTGQAFHLQDKEKVEVIDTASDLLFYDATQNNVSYILRTDSILETFPAWSPTGDYLYYCAADVRSLNVPQDSLTTGDFLKGYRSLHYDIMRLPFDAATQDFGTPELVVDCASNGKSATLPRISPDGRFLLFSLADYGQFHVWHKSSDLYVTDLEENTTYPLSKANSRDADSYHSWSSNSRWIIFSCRRDDGSYTRLYITYFDKKGKSRKAFLIPQRDPASNLLLLKSYNVPELTQERIHLLPETFRQIIHTDGITPIFISK